MYQLIPNVKELETNLENFASIIDADEVLLFERATFLVSSQPGGGLCEIISGGQFSFQSITIKIHISMFLHLLYSDKYLVLKGNYDIMFAED